MMIRPQRSIVLTVAVLGIAALFIAQSPAFANEPGGDAESAQLAIQNPDEFAWKLFLWINRQALPGTAGEADPAKPSVLQYEADKDVIWETWALASRDGQPEAEVFLADGVKPGRWADLPRGNPAPKALDRNRTAAHQQSMEAAQLSRGTLAPQFVQQEPDTDEVRMNRATFEFVRDNDLYYRQGLAAAFARGAASGDRDVIQFPAMAKEVKARWEPICESEKPRFHWRTIGNQAWGLKAFHIISKDLPMWFWTDFIHVDLEAAEPDPCRDSTTRGPGAPHGHDGIRQETEGSKWQYYRLKGSQVDFADARGRPTILGNQLIESGNAATSSCITCHAGAGVRSNGGAHVFGFITGLPPADAFGTGNQIKVLQIDFLYSVVLRAQSQPNPTPAPAPPGVVQAPRRQSAGKRIVEGFPPQAAARLAMRQRQQRVTDDLARAEGLPPSLVQNLLKRWGIGSTITVAFRGGTTDLHRRIANATLDWTNQGNIKLDFGWNPQTNRFREWSPSDTTYRAAIRVSFDQSGYWSYVGRDSRDPQIAPPGEPSMNFEDFAVALPGNWRGVVLHEFGHALAIEHEHSSPAGNCDAEFRWDDDPGYVRTRDSFNQFIEDSAGRRPGLYTVLGGPPNDWPPQVVDFNLRQLPNSSAFQTTAFDSHSIMKYFFEDWMFQNGAQSSCYSSSENNVLSPLDIAGIKTLYPGNPSAAQELSKRRGDLIQRLESLRAVPASHLEHLKQ